MLWLIVAVVDVAVIVIFLFFCLLLLSTKKLLELLCFNVVVVFVGVVSF